MNVILVQQKGDKTMSCDAFDHYDAWLESGYQDWYDQEDKEQEKERREAYEEDQLDMYLERQRGIA